jgi:hypothetical protein
MKMIIIGLEIGNAGDDHTRWEYFTAMDTDKGAWNNLKQHALGTVRLDRDWGENVYRVQTITPRNCATNEKDFNTIEAIQKGQNDWDINYIINK